MASIVTVDAGEKGRILREVWTRVGGHSTSDALDDVDDASVVLFGGSGPEALSKAGSRLAGKIIIDCSSPQDITALRSAAPTAETLARTYPDARIVKALDGVTTDALAFIAAHKAPEIGTVYTSAFYCGNDDQAKRVVAGLIEEVNLDPIDCGPLGNAVLLESIGLLERYFETHGLDSPFAITLVRPPRDRSPLDRWM